MQELIMKIAISSGKGGSGKTILSTNLAAYWSETEDLTLIDLDVEEPNAGLFIKGDIVAKETKFKMVPEWNRESCKEKGTCREVCNFNAIVRLGPELIVFPELCHSCYACVDMCPENALKMVPSRIGELTFFQNSALKFIESRLDIGQEQAVQLIAQTKKYAENEFPANQYLIFDLPPGTSCPVVESVKDADIVILITEPTPFGLHDLKLSVDLMKHLNKKHAVVLNRFGIGDDSVEKYCDDMNIPIIAKIHHSRKIAELYSKGELIYDKVPEFRKQIESIRDYIVREKA